MVRAALARPYWVSLALAVGACRSCLPLFRVVCARFRGSHISRVAQCWLSVHLFFVLCVVRGVGFVSLNLFLVLRACVLALSTSTKCIVRESPCIAFAIGKRPFRYSFCVRSYSCSTLSASSFVSSSLSFPFYCSLYRLFC